MEITTVQNPFAAGELEKRKVRALERRKRMTLGFCLMLVIPLILILVDIFYKAWPVLSWDYLWENP
jgi:hypothetical protein